MYDYYVGKLDWIACDLPTEGEGEHPDRITHFMDRTVPTCRTDEPVKGVTARLEGSGWDVCAVLNEHNIVQGRLRPQKIDPDDARPAEEAMEPGPATERPHASYAAAIQRMQSHRVATLLISTPDGVLLGVIRAST